MDTDLSIRAMHTIRTNPGISYYRLARQLAISESRMESLLVTLIDSYSDLWQDDVNRLYVGPIAWEENGR